jgi:hypothetical protein
MKRMAMILAAAMGRLVKLRDHKPRGRAVGRRGRFVP